jgi:putative ABC transport system ATP-binding protein
MPVIAADDLYRFYHARDDETRALRGVSFAVEAGEFVALVGPSGSGKSTLLSCLAGLDVPDGGQVVLNNERIARLPEAERAKRRRLHVGILMQSRNLLPGLTAEENVHLPMMLAGRPHRDRAAALLDQVGVLPRRHALPHELSGGEAARVGLAVALALSPSVIFADEPTAEVDAVTEKDLLRLLSDHCVAGGAAVVATHSEALAQTASRVIRLQDGRIVDDTADRQG